MRILTAICFRMGVLSAELFKLIAVVKLYLDTAARIGARGGIRMGRKAGIFQTGGNSRSGTEIKK